MTKTRMPYKYLALIVLTFSMGIAIPAFAESVEHYIDDATITAKVKEAILADAQLKVLDVKVETLHGVVSLSGAVDSEAQVVESIKVASQISGVRSVTDGLSVENTHAD
jgi:hyperosmotically inducible protein